MKFAYLIMGNSFDSKRDRAAFEGGGVQMIGVSDIDDAAAVAKELYEGGIDCIEVCGAFCEEGARRIIEATENKVPVGFSVHLPEQDELFNKLFG